MSKKKEIREMANLVGNSAAHIALLPDSDFALKEASTYTEDAVDTASSRTWSAREIEEFKELALKRASSEIRERVVRYGLPKGRLGSFISMAERYISLFAENHLEQ